MRVACGDWDRDGNVDLFVELGGAMPGDRFHNVLFQNPGQGNNWLTVKLIGQKTNRAAIGARIKVVTAAKEPLTVHRHISSGSSFGGNPLQQTIGLAKADRVAQLEIYWPTSGTTQVFRDVDVNQAIEVTEFATAIPQTLELDADPGAELIQAFPPIRPRRPAIVPPRRMAADRVAPTAEKIVTLAGTPALGARVRRLSTFSSQSDGSTSHTPGGNCPSWRRSPGPLTHGGMAHRLTTAQRRTGPPGRVSARHAQSGEGRPSAAVHRQ